MATVTAVLGTVGKSLLAGASPFEHYLFRLFPVNGFPGTQQDVTSETTTGVFLDVPDGRYVVHANAVNQLGSAMEDEVLSDEFTVPADAEPSTFQGVSAITVTVS